MMKFFLFLYLLQISTASYSQGTTDSKKTIIDTSVFAKWSNATAPKISNDGNFVVYTVSNQPIGSNTMVIASTKSKWHRSFFYSSSYKAKFTEDSKKLIFLNEGDTLCFHNLLDSTTEYQTSVSSFKLSVSKSNEWIAFTNKSVLSELNLLDLKTNEKRLFPDVIDFEFIDNGNRLIITSQDQNKNIILVITALQSGNVDTIYRGKEIQDLIIDNEFSQLAFVENDTKRKPFRSLWFYKLGSKEAISLVNDETKIDGRFYLKKIERFSKDGKRIFLKLIDKKELIRNPNAAKVDVWSYTDPVLQSAQSNDLSQSFYSVINIQDKRIIQLEREYERISFLKPFKRNREEYSIVIHREGCVHETNWNIKSKPSIYLVSNINGDRKQLSKGTEVESPYSYTLSPDEKFVVYFDAKRRNYFSFEISTGTYRNITQDIKSIWTKNDDLPSSPTIPVGIAGFTEKDEDVILYDQNDIYQVDLRGNRKSINLTNGNGKIHNQIFRVAIDHSDFNFTNGEHIILSAFNRNNKKDGFYKVVLGNQSDPELRTMEPYIFVGTNENSDVLVEKPIKARHGNGYVVRRMNAQESPNYFYTQDFKKFTQLSFVYPEKEYIWMTSELVAWKTLDGGNTQGILYKPSNFDPTKKYPVIFYYYEKLSNGLNGYLQPELSNGPLNIPFYVSNGYLVFIPDIHFKIGHPGRSVLNTVLSAANYLAKLPYIDSKHMGLQGHSRGGWETNLLIAHTNIFAAAVSASGFCDYVSLYNGIRNLSSGTSRQTAFEIHYQRIGATLWENPTLFIENSPIFRADKIATPLLMMNNKNDDDIPFEQGVELFTALRRLGKKAWMLQYDGEGHLVNGKAAEDFTIRMKQFFDHYLKDTPAPKWMTRGIPASMKGIDDGLELDTEIKTRWQGLLGEKKTNN